ncbi:MAG TPA: magnesium/cobalt transporter CorA [Segeticoccus sp.]|uniref:magnesium/cobalt transporter CorA n=1 Tax=Segeticoccus sp. TaxID=2706531 RepID=UPI002D7F95BC|nr:magnesium/cobalt transporter CorA [Segeticoccus sp.]HET8600498.1 magnesium/cobalt transporter CorA [Segeticoccus sp.]
MSDRTFAPIRSLTSRVLRPPRPGPDLAPGRADRHTDDRVDGAVGTSLVDSAIYVDGDRIDTPETLRETYATLHQHDGAVAWIGLYRPDHHEIASLAAEFDLHELAVEDAILAHQRPKIERYDETLFVVLKAARYLDDSETLEFGELHLFVGPDFVVTVRHSEAPDLSGVRRRLESNPELLRLGPEAILYAILDRVVDGYAPVVAGLGNDIDEIETEVFLGEPNVSRRIYELTREVIEFQRASKPLAAVLGALAAGFEKYGTDEELQRYLRDVDDHLTLVIEQVDGFRQLLRDILTVNATLVAQQQNEEMKSLTEASIEQNEEVKRISAWAAIIFAPSLIGTVYGMNFDVMPELSWRYGYPFAIFLMALVSTGLYLAFRRRGWL